MKFIDKIKNYFYDEDEEDVNKKKTATTSPTVNAKPKFEFNKEEKKEAPKVEVANVDTISERELFKSDPTFNFPIIFDEDDLKEEKVKPSRIAVNKYEQTKFVEPVVKRVFKPSPNISPVYGIIDSDANSNNQKNGDDNLLKFYDKNKKIDIDDVLGKVYEPKRVEINQENYEEIKVKDSSDSKDDLTIDLFNNIEIEKKEQIKTKIEVKGDSIAKTDEKLKSIDELLENTNDEDFYSLVDSMYKEDNEEDDK